MNRKYTRQIFHETVRRLRDASPDFTVTTDIIVGFPGETDQDFQETLAVMREVEFAKVHMFPYSDRPRTKSATFANKVPHEVIRERKSEVLRVSEEIAFSLRQRFVGRKMRILTEEHGKDAAHLFGHTENFLGVIIPKDNWSTNQILEVELIANSPDGLIGKVVE